MFKRVTFCLLSVLSCLLPALAQEAPPSALFDSRALLDDLRVLSADDMQGRQTGTRGGEKARAFVVRRFRESGVVPFGSSYEQPFTFAGRGPNTTVTGANVIGYIEGSREPRRHIVISAHYDHIGTRNGLIFNGADDNASGTAALFALAGYFAIDRPSNSLIFAAFDAEEIGHRGSRFFLQHAPVDAGLLAVNLNADMIGREPDNRLFVVGTATQPFLRPVIDAVAARSPVRLLTGHEDPGRPEDWTRDSDHYSFMQAGIPAPYFGVEDFDEHHQATDDYATMTFDFYVRAVETLVRVVEEFDADLDAVEAIAR